MKIVNKTMSIQEIAFFITVFILIPGWIFVIIYRELQRNLLFHCAPFPIPNNINKKKFSRLKEMSKILNELWEVISRYSISFNGKI